MTVIDAGEAALVQEGLLRRFYLAYFPAQEWLAVRDVMRQEGWNEDAMFRALEQMSRDGLVRLRDSGPHYELLPFGVLETERRQLVPADAISTHARIRTAVLAKYAEAYESAGTGERGEKHYREITRAVAAEAAVEEALVVANHEFLFDADYLAHPGSLGFFVITDRALQAVREWRKHAALEQAFETLRDAVPESKRGRSFQTLFGQFARGDGWNVDESEGGPGEELDLVLSNGDLYYILECRWKADPVEAKEIRDFQGKLRKRSGVFGLVVSMSGYTAGATGEAVSGAGEAPTLFVGPGEISDLFARKVDFADLLNEKRKRLILRREVPSR
jgi:hypothetical protein